MNQPNQITVQISGMGTVPSFKNRKRIFRGRLVTEQRVKNWMDQAANSIIYQLKSLFQTGIGGTQMGDWRQFAISSWPSDDCWEEIPHMEVSVRLVKEGEEGAVIRLTKLPQTIPTNKSTKSTSTRTSSSNKQTETTNTKQNHE